MHARIKTASFWRENVVSRRHSTTSFSENVEVAKTSFQMLSFIILRSEEGVTSFTKCNGANFSCEK